MSPDRAIYADHPSTVQPPPQQMEEALLEIGVQRSLYQGGSLFVRSPIDGSRIGRLYPADGTQCDQAMHRADIAAQQWRDVAPARRGAFLRLVADRLRKLREPLARVVTLETGKCITESRLKVDYAIACCDQAFALAHDLDVYSVRRRRHGMWLSEEWRPLGATGCISPFNRPLSHFSAFAFTSLVCGNAVVWKPSESGSLTALALGAVVNDAARNCGDVPKGLLTLLLGGRDIGKTLSEDFRLRFLDAATTTATGRVLNMKLAQGFVRGALSLGAANSATVCASADLALTVNAIVASVTLGNGQSNMCTRRLFVHADLYDRLVDKLARVFERLAVGDPRLQTTMMGPLVDRPAFEAMQRTLQWARSDGARVTGGERVTIDDAPAAYYVRPALVEFPTHREIMLRETQAPILFVVRASDLGNAIAMDNAADAGLASAIFTRNMAEADQFLARSGNGILTVNALTSGYEPGMAACGAKTSAGGRLSVGESWQTLMQRSVITMNMSSSEVAPDVIGMVERNEI